MINLSEYLNNLNEGIYNDKTRKPVVGQYYYAPHRKLWGVWQWTMVTNDGASGSFVKDFKTRDDARDFVYKMNGWVNK